MNHYAQKNGDNGKNFPTCWLILLFFVIFALENEKLYIYKQQRELWLF